MGSNMLSIAWCDLMFGTISRISYIHFVLLFGLSFFIVCTRNYKVSLMSVSLAVSAMATEVTEGASALSICCTGLVQKSFEWQGGCVIIRKNNPKQCLSHPKGLSLYNKCAGFLPRYMFRQPRMNLKLTTECLTPNAKADVNRIENQRFHGIYIESCWI